MSFREGKGFFLQNAGNVGRSSKGGGKNFNCHTDTLYLSRVRMKAHIRPRGHLLGRYHKGTTCINPPLDEQEGVLFIDTWWLSSQVVTVSETFCECLLIVCW